MVYVLVEVDDVALVDSDEICNLGYDARGILAVDKQNGVALCIHYLDVCGLSGKIIIFLSKFIKIEEINKIDNKPTNERYRQFKVDDEPIIEPFATIEHKDHKQLIRDNNIKPINRRNGKEITIDVKCPCCGAPKDYLWDNTGRQNQFKCKVCSYTFSIHLNKDKDVILKCPHCRHVLNHRISRAYSSQYIIGLCLTYHVNYGMSYRQTAALLRNVHEVYISYKTVENYCKAVSTLVHPLLEFYPYELSDTIAADETYIKVLGKTNYIFFYFDAIKKIVTSYRVFEKRDSLSSIKASYATLSKFNGPLPEDLKVISDGNPIYNIAVQYWTQHNMPFKLYQVIGLTNQDDISKEYRSQKQIIERHNRTLKYYYRPKGGFDSLNNANSYMVLFATCFNFLRPHSALKYKVPVEIPELSKCTNMPNKWIELINLSYKYLDIYH